MTSDILSPDNEAFEQLLNNLSEHLNDAANIPPQALFHQLILSKAGRQQVINYLDTLSRLAHKEESPIDSAQLTQWMLPALNALVTCDTDCFPAVYRSLAATGVSDALLLTVQKSMLYWSGNPDCWNHLLLLLNSHPAGLNPRFYTFLSEQLAVGDNSTYWHTTRDEHTQRVLMPRFIRAAAIKLLFGQGADYINTCLAYNDEPNRKARLQRVEEEAQQLVAALEPLQQTLFEIVEQEKTGVVLPEHQLLTDMAPVIKVMFPKPDSEEEEPLTVWQNERNRLSLTCINVAIAILKGDEFATELLKSDLLLSWPQKNATQNLNAPAVTASAVIAPAVMASAMQSEGSEHEWVKVQALQLFEQDDSHNESGSAWLSHAIAFFDDRRNDFKTLSFEQVTSLVIEQAQEYFNDCHPLAHSDNPEWQQALSQLDWQKRAGEVFSYGSFGQDIGDVIQNPTRQEKRVTIQTNDFIGITYKLRDPEPFPQGRVAVNNRVEVFSPTGKLLRTDQWPDQMIANTTNFVLYRMELADSYAGYWRFTSWYGDQCLLQQSFHVNPAVPVTN